ncbi:putative 5-methylcytosine g t mismatch-specific dna [Diaporthe ampelina]|uniref:Putative 5-methylcytosine g t mismatch-specific dna n=1 Tax=Diaporthe ampelina TaxID=1214573 RepID=A0A0G2FB64_9PEZI|nr:putative 5-methylcytosine g t mismatch-specific dna [Diaporthe ampelina]
MSSRDRDVDADDVPREKRSSRTKGDRERTRDKDRDRESRRHHKSHKSSNPVIATGSYVSQSGSARRHKLRDASSSKSRLEEPLDENSSMTDLVPELNRSRDRVHIPYPTFSKAHSKESVASKDDLSTSSAAGQGAGTGTDPLTPETTDLGAGEDIKRSKSADFSSKRKLSRKTNRPPSPPDTNLSAEKKRSTGSVRLKDAGDDRPRSRTSHASRSTSKTDETSKVSRKSKSSSQATFKLPGSKGPVDYLMQNGGLPNVVPKNFLAVLPRQNGTRPSNPPLRGAETLFAPFFNLLDQYQDVLTNRGSIAVATGHRTVARRLLDRLEDVFNRDLPEEGCNCIMFKIDPDIAEEFREHYLRQSKKVKAAVDRWLTNCAEAPAPPPQDVDDETLTFAILTALDHEDRPYFNALLTGARELQPALRAPTPMRKPRADLVIKSGLALQRLYRLPQAPRDAETVCYLVKHPQMHDLLSTICDINPPEWEILISGRFDGFLCSAYPNRQAVSNDEESEIAVLAELEREIYVGMEALEDAFETLHQRAELVRTALRQRGAGLSMSLQQRRGYGVLDANGGIQVLPQSGGSVPGMDRPQWADEESLASESTDDWGIDADWELRPDDSASNISSSRQRRPKRRDERRSTPAPIREEDET